MVICMFWVAGNDLSRVRVFLDDLDFDKLGARVETGFIARLNNALTLS